jgi:hypothetical protein
MFSAVEKRAKGAGYFGLFATNKIAAATVIVPKWHEDFYVGMEGWHCLEAGEILCLPSEEKNLFIRYGLDVNFSQIVGPRAERYVYTLDNFINHSCDPTLTYDHYGNVVTRHDLESDEELTIDYGCFTVNFDEGFECDCGSPNCRGIVTKDDWRGLAARYGYGMPRFLHPHIESLLGQSSPQSNG